jgi:hypothetical protein
LRQKVPRSPHKAPALSYKVTSSSAQSVDIAHIVKKFVFPFPDSRHFTAKSKIGGMVEKALARSNQQETKFNE